MPKKTIVREAWTRRTDVYKEAFHDLRSRIGVITEILALTPVQKKVIPELLLAEIDGALKRACQLKNWEKDLEKNGEI